MLLGQFLLCIKNTKVTEKDITEAIKIQEEYNKEGKEKKIGEILIEMGIINEKDLVEYLDLREALNKIDFCQYLKRMNA